MDVHFWLKPIGGYDSHPGFTPEIKKWIYERDGYMSTAEYLDKMKWIEKDWK